MCGHFYWIKFLHPLPLGIRIGISPSQGLTLGRLPSTTPLLNRPMGMKGYCPMAPQDSPETLERSPGPATQQVQSWCLSNEVSLRHIKPHTQTPTDTYRHLQTSTDIYRHLQRLSSQLLKPGNSRSAGDEETGLHPDNRMLLDNKKKWAIKS